MERRLRGKELCDCRAFDTKLAREIEVVTDLSRKAIYETARNAAGQEGLDKRNNGYLEHHRAATERSMALETTINDLTSPLL